MSCRRTSSNIGREGSTRQTVGGASGRYGSQAHLGLLLARMRYGKLLVLS